MVPMMWFTQRATLTPELAGQAKVCNFTLCCKYRKDFCHFFSIQMALVLPALGIYIAIFLGTTGTILVGIFAFMCIRKWSAEVPYEELQR